MKTALAVFLLLIPGILPAIEAAASDRAPWEDPVRSFRMTLTLLGTAEDPVTHDTIRLDGVAAPVVLVPLDLSAALLQADEWPLDPAGLPAAWTPALSSVRVFANGRELHARLLPLTLGNASSPGHVQATLALTLDGPIVYPADLTLYFDIEERDAPIAPESMGTLFGPGPLVRARARAPSLAPDATLDLVVIPLSASGARVIVERLSSASAPETLVDERTSTPVQRFRLPSVEGGYDFLTRLDAPAFLAIDARTPSGPAPGLIFPNLTGGRAGTAVVVAGLGAPIDVVATARTSYVARDVTDGREVARGDLARLGITTLNVPEGAAWFLASDAPLAAFSRGAVRSDADAFLAQAVATDGGPTGPLLLAPRARSLVATADEPRTLQAYPLKRPGDLASGRAADPPRYAWTSTTPNAAESEPWAVLAEGTKAQAVAGANGQLGVEGLVGTSFRLPFPPASAGAPPLVGAIETQLPDTHVTVHLRALNGTLLHSSDTTLSRPGSLTTTPDGSRALLQDAIVIEVESDKPVTFQAGRPHAPGATFLGGLPPVAHARIGPVEFSGALVAWTETSKEANGKAGETLRVSLTLANRGRSPDGSPRTEDVSLSLAAAAGACERSWDATLVESTFNALASPAERVATVLVTIPSDARPDDCAEFALVANTSDGAASAEARLVARARSSFDLRLRAFDTTGAPVPRLGLQLAAGEATDILLRVTNLGTSSGNATIGIAATPGYLASFLHDPQMTLAPHEERNATLRLVAQSGAGPWDLVLEAASRDDPTVRDQVVLRLAPRTNASFDVRAEESLLHPTRARNATTRLDITNAGDDLDMRIRLASVIPPGWNVTISPASLLLRANGTRAEDGSDLARAMVTMSVAAPPDARVGMRLPIALRVEPVLAPELARTIGIVATVANTYDIAIPAVTVEAAPTGKGDLEIPLPHAEHFEIDVRGIAAPAGWTVNVTPAPNVLHLTYSVAPSAPAGQGSIRLDLKLHDDVSPEAARVVDIPATTLRRGILRASVPTSAELPPGATREIEVELTNVGNEPATLVVPQVADLTVETGTSPLAPENTTRSVVTLRAGDGFQGATLRIADRILTITTPRDDLALTLAEPAGPGAWRIVVENRGTRASGPIQVEIGDSTGARRNVTLPPILPAGTGARVVLAPDDLRSIRVADPQAASDATPRDNLVEFASGGTTRATPNVPLFAILAALALIALGRRAG